jgi:hypothetical protein
MNHSNVYVTFIERSLHHTRKALVAPNPVDRVYHIHMAKYELENAKVERTFTPKAVLPPRN